MGEQVAVSSTSFDSFVASRVECFGKQGLRGHGLSNSAQDFLRGKTVRGSSIGFL
ncbi:Hypothetical protein PMT_2904 [Prochlorococcus marinus str. MIT 9313]|uniref:Uncharacterized protein n=1 Tax=Prochlorococcus marinus (strain MIT 9313) TaxID=74547 RepID=B9ESR8_PROMM|nr:Hypothetical protein PMT_2904 [Prochlorococcus marinus str. MIT 9313]